MNQSDLNNFSGAMEYGMEKNEEKTNCRTAKYQQQQPQRPVPGSNGSMEPSNEMK